MIPGCDALARIPPIQEKTILGRDALARIPPIQETT
jgi:hypothetical protein